MTIAIILFSTSLLLFPLLLNWWRQNITYNFKLLPNCLLTRYPIIFICGYRSPFYFGNYWNWIPQLLEAHGFDVMELELHPHRSRQRRRELSAFLELSRGEKYHFIADASCEHDLIWLLEQNSSCVESCWLTTDSDHHNSHPELKKLQFAPEKNHLTRQWYWKLLIAFHNFLSPRHRAISPFLVGLLESSRQPKSLHQYLQWAISLAENDLKC